MSSPSDQHLPEHLQAHLQIPTAVSRTYPEFRVGRNTSPGISLQSHPIGPSVLSQSTSMDQSAMLLGGQSVHEASLLAQAAQIRGAIELLKLEHRAVLSTIQYGSQQYHENSSTWNQTPPTSQHQPNTTSLSNSSIQQFPFGSTPLMWNAPRISSIDLGRQPSHRDQDIVSPMPTVAADPRYPCDIAVSDHPACAGAVLGGWPVPGRAAPPWISSAWGRGETSDAADGRGFGAGPDFRRGAQRRPEDGNETASDAAAAPESERRPPGRPAHQAGKAILDAAVSPGGGGGSDGGGGSSIRSGSVRREDSRQGSRRHPPVVCPQATAGFSLQRCLSPATRRPDASLAGAGPRSRRRRRRRRRGAMS